MSRPQADRNLLFGINALQNDFITRDALIAAMNAWALEKHRAIGDILVDRGDLTPAARALLDQLLDHHLARHGGDAAASLAAMSSIEGVADDLRRSVDDTDVLESIAHVSPESQADPHATRAPEMTDHVPAGLRFRKVRNHAEGGLGIVFVARDEELNREVALKEIKPKYADNLASQARFLVEAEITGGLEHPGIVPVYGLGHYDDGRPYYAMRFIRGDSLKDAIKAFHAEASLKNDPGARTLALQKLLRRFLDVCNAVAYAHNRGVLHRDLKPDNVMVGKYGETLVVDWGLAKTVGRSGNDAEGHLPESTLRPNLPSGSAETLPNSVIGTPGYMSPEQAAGRLDLLGPASDVYSLGATLYTLLTGRVPFSGQFVPEILHKVERGEFPRPRESTPWLDPALEAIVLQAMALKPEARYASPWALADDVERWIADEPVAAYPEPFIRRARRLAKRHRTSLTTATAATLVAALLISGFAWQTLERRRQTDDAGRTILANAEALATQARTSGQSSAWQEAVAEALRAKERLDSGDGSPAIRLAADARLKASRTEQAHRAETLAAEAKDDQVVAALEEARLRASDVKDNSYDTQARIDAYLLAFRAYGIDLTTLPVEEAAQRIRSSRVVDDLIATLDNWSSYRPRNVPKERLAAIARAAETDQIRASIREAVSRRDSAALRRFCESEGDRRKLGPRVRLIFDSLLSLEAAGNFPLLETILREHPSDFWLNQDLGMAYLNAKPPKPAETVHYLSIAVALRPGSPGVHYNLGNALGAQGKLDEAVAEYREAIRLKPDYAEAHVNLGAVLISRGNFDEPIAEFRLAIQIKPELPQARVNLGAALHAQGKLDDAIAEYRAALRMKPDDADTHYSLGLALQDRGKLDDAIAEYRATIRIKSDYALAYNNLGNVLRAQRKLDDAMVEFRNAIQAKPELALAHNNLGHALKDRGKLDDAVTEYRIAIRIKPDDAEAHNYLGVAFQELGKLDDALAEYRVAIRHKPDYAEAHVHLGLGLGIQGKLDDAVAEFHTAIRSKPGLSQAHFNLGLVLQAQGKLNDAVAEFHTAIRIAPDYMDAHFRLGLASAAQGKPDEASAEFRIATRLKPDYPDAHTCLGVALQELGNLDEAIAELRISTQLKPGYAPAHYNLANILNTQGKSHEAIAEFRETIRLNPNYAEALCNLGLILGRQGFFRESLEKLERGHMIGSGRTSWRNPSEAWVNNARRLVELEARIPAILKGEANPADAGERLALADMCSKKGFQAASARFYDEAFAEQPALAADLAKGHRYDAARVASLAGSGSSKDEPALDEVTRAKLRAKTRDWLQADLMAWGKVLDGSNEPGRKQAVAKTLAHWKEDSDLAGIRDEKPLAKLADGEREGFRALWAEVDRVLAKAR